MLVSVVIPAYNEEKYLPKTLESILAQAHPDFDYEVIVVDSSSTDKTGEVAQNYGAKVLRTIKKTPAFARQKGVEQAQGEIICCLDADTWAPKDHLVNVVSEFKKDPGLVGLTGIIDGWGGTVFQRFTYKWVHTFLIWFSFLLGKPGFQGQSFAFQKSAFLRVGGFKTDIHTCEDLDLGYRMSKVGKLRFLFKTFGISSIRRIQEDPLKTTARGLVSYFRLLWGIPLAKKKEREPFPAIR